ncbi:hypothetical protein [Arenibacterium sp. LLYu02]|uniref:hypothetical protein n=1 Tax=Arenibacterium sp. LLYu02 TaxID=3404132 RepID=UPI003B225A08
MKIVALSIGVLTALCLPVAAQSLVDKNAEAPRGSVLQSVLGTQIEVERVQETVLIPLDIRKGMTSSSGSHTCDIMRWLVEVFEAQSQARITIHRNGQTKEIVVPASPHQDHLISTKSQADH